MLNKEKLIDEFLAVRDAREPVVIDVPVYLGMATPVRRTVGEGYSVPFLTVTSEKFEKKDACYPTTVGTLQARMDRALMAVAAAVYKKHGVA